MNANLIPANFHYANPNCIDYIIKSDLSEKSGEVTIIFENNGNQIYLDNIEIRSDLRSKGIGTEILLKLIQFCKNFGTKRLYLLVDFDNEKAQQLYTNLGFELTGNITQLFCYEMEYIL